MTCWKCGKELDPAMRYCLFCGADKNDAPPPRPSSSAEYRFCFTCGARNLADQRFCNRCGAPLDGSEAAARAQRQAQTPPPTAPVYSPARPAAGPTRRRLYPYEIAVLICGPVSLALALLFGGYNGPFGPRFEIAFYGLILTAALPLILSVLPAAPEDRRKKPPVTAIILTVILFGFAILTSITLVESAPTRFYYGSAPAYFNLLLGVLMPVLFIRCLVGVIPKQD